MKHISDKIIEFGSHDEGTIQQIRNIAAHPSVVRAILCADGHLGFSMPIGGVAAYDGLVSPNGVGYDIGCGNLAVRTDLRASHLEDGWHNLAHEILEAVSFGIGRTNPEPVESNTVYKHPAWAIPAVKELRKLAVDQLGTVGAGNHFVDLLSDEKGWLWVGVHFGSRGLGHRIATHYVKVNGGKDGSFAAPVLLNVDSSMGQEYLAAMDLAGKYAMAGREWVVKTILDILDATAQLTVHNHHNFAWKETHFGRELWVVRKGATPAFPGQYGFIGGSMGDISAIVKGIPTSEAREAMYSTIHGAGRLMSRTAAAGKSKWKHGKKTRLGSGLVSREMMDGKLNAMKVILYGGDLDEAPQVYRPLADVLNAHSNTIEIEEILTPKLVLMAPGGLEDPYRD